MELEERFKEILEGGDRCELIDFLLSLNSKEKKEIQTLLKSMMSIDESRAYYLRTYSYLEGRSYSEQKQLLSLLKCAVVMLFGVRDIKKLHLPITLGEIKDVLYRYKPRWLEGDLSKNSWSSIISSITYNDLVDLYKKGVISYDKELFAKYIELSFEFFDKVKDKNRFAKDDLWLAFEYGNYISDVKECYALLERVESDFDVDRLYILDKILLGVKDVDTIYIKSYWELFVSFKPTDIELLALIDTLFVLLDSGSARLVKPTLRYIKSIIELDGFDVAGFIQRVPKIISLDNKSIVNDIFVISNKIIKCYPKYKKDITLSLIDVFSLKDERIEVKYIKFIQKNRLLEDKDVLGKIEFYYEQLFSSSKTLLPMLNIATKVDEMVGDSPRSVINKDSAICYFDTLDELLIFFSSVFENNDVNNFELCMENILRLDKVVDINSVMRLLPIIEKTYKLSTDYHYNKGLVTFIAMSTFLEYAKILGDRFTLFKQYVDDIIKDSIYLEFILEKPFYYSVHTHLSSIVKNKLLEKEYSSLLSTPTHHLSYIEDTVFIERLLKIEDISTIDIIDFQVAILRVVFCDSSISSKLEGLPMELRRVLLYLIGELDFQSAYVVNPELWIMALIRRREIDDIKSFSLMFDSDIFPYKLPPYRAGDIIYDYDAYKVNDKLYLSSMSSDNHKIINIDPAFIKDRARVKNIFSTIYDKNRNYDLHKGDNEKFLLLAPFAYDYIILFLLYIYSFDFGFFRANSTRGAKDILPVLQTIWSRDIKGYGYTYIAASLLSKDKDVRVASFEFWYSLSLIDSIDNQLLGKELAQLLDSHYAPILRLSDLLSKRALHLSTLHNQSLYELISSILVSINITSARGLKQILEIYLEVCIVTQNRVPSDVVKSIEKLKKIKTLKPVVEKISLFTFG